jgi:hypothetical protein
MNLVLMMLTIAISNWRHANWTIIQFIHPDLQRHDLSWAVRGRPHKLSVC